MRAFGAFSTMTFKEKWTKLQLTLCSCQVKLLGRSSSWQPQFFRFRLQTNRRHRKKPNSLALLFIYIFLLSTSSRRTGFNANVLVDVIIIWFHRLVFVRLVLSCERENFSIFFVVVVCENLDFASLLLFLLDFRAHLTVTHHLTLRAKARHSWNGRNGLKQLLARQRILLDLKTRRSSTLDLGSDQRNVISRFAKWEFSLPRDKGNRVTERFQEW